MTRPTGCSRSGNSSIMRCPRIVLYRTQRKTSSSKYRWYLRKEPNSPSNDRTTQLEPLTKLSFGRDVKPLFPAPISKSEVTIDCYCEKRSRSSPWSGSAPTGARAWGGPPVAVQETRQKSIFSSRKFRLYQHALAALEHASILSPSIRSPHGSANGYALMETCLLFALYLLRSIGSLEQFETRPRSSYERACQDRGRSFRFCFFCFSVPKLYTKLKNNTVLLITVLLLPLTTKKQYHTALNPTNTKINNGTTVPLYMTPTYNSKTAMQYHMIYNNCLLFPLPCEAPFPLFASDLHFTPGSK